MAVSYSSTIKLDPGVAVATPGTAPVVVGMSVLAAVCVCPQRMALWRYVLFIHTTQRLTRVRRLPSFRVSEGGFLQGGRGEERGRERENGGKEERRVSGGDRRTERERKKERRECGGQGRGGRKRE